MSLSKHDMNESVKLPWRLYRNEPSWIPKNKPPNGRNRRHRTYAVLGPAKRPLAVDRAHCHHVAAMNNEAHASVRAPAGFDAGCAEDEETVDGLPVLAEVRPIERVVPTSLPAVQAAAAAATGFVAGAAAIALVRRHSSRKLARARRHQRRAVDMLPIVGSRTFLVDVHLIAKPGE